MSFDMETMEMMQAQHEAQCGWSEWLSAIDAEEREQHERLPDEEALAEARRTMHVLGSRLSQPAQRFPECFEQTIEQYQAAVRTLGLPRAGTGRFWSSDGFTDDARDLVGGRWSRCFLGMGWAAL